MMEAAIVVVQKSPRAVQGRPARSLQLGMGMRWVGVGHRSSLLRNDRNHSDGGARAAPIVVRAASGIAELAIQMSQQDLANAWIERRTGRTIEIDGSIGPFHKGSNVIIAQCGC